MWAARAEPGPVISLRESHSLLGSLSRSKPLLQQQAFHFCSPGSGSSLWALLLFPFPAFSSLSNLGSPWPPLRVSVSTSANRYWDSTPAPGSHGPCEIEQSWGLPSQSLEGVASCLLSTTSPYNLPPHLKRSKPKTPPGENLWLPTADKEVET